ncbi:MAG: chemotaxis protein CheB [Thiogranum sp.]
MTGRTEKASPERTLFPIIGIGASAGGLDAFKRFVTSMPADSGMAFVLVQHLDPNHESLTAELLARHTTMQVVEARDQMPVEIDHVYMIPPNKYLTIHDNVLQLSEPVLRRGLRLPIDNFFRSLTETNMESYNRSFAEAIVNTIHEPLLILDKRLKVVAASPAFYTTFRTDTKATEGRSIFDIGNGQWNIPTLRTLLADIVPGRGEFNDYEVTQEFPDIGNKTMLLNARMIERLPDQAVSILLAIKDISKQKIAEQAFIGAKNTAEEVNQAKSRFLAAASHDLRQPLQALSLLNRVLTNTVRDPRALEIIEKQTESIVSMGELLDALLNLSKIQAGAVEPVVRGFAVADMLVRLKREFELQAKEKGLRLHVAPCSVTIRSDPVLLDRIIHIFIANAISYTTEGKVLIGCRRQGSSLRIEVWDTGAGIPADRLESILVEFHQLDNPAREKSKGMGLGLAVAKYTARLLGHRIDVRSTLGKGSMFAVEVPMGEMSNPVQTGLTDSDAATVTAPAQTSVLMIDDDAAVLDATCLLLESQGFHVVAATSGAEALSLLASGELQPYCVISDYRLPDGLTGTELIQRIRGTLKRDIPAVVLTGDISPEAMQTLQESGCKILYKPVRTNELVLTVKQMIGKQDRPARGAEK